MRERVCVFAAIYSSVEMAIFVQSSKHIALLVDTKLCIMVNSL